MFDERAFEEGYSIERERNAFYMDVELDNKYFCLKGPSKYCFMCKYEKVCLDEEFLGREDI